MVDQGSSLKRSRNKPPAASTDWHRPSGCRIYFAWPSCFDWQQGVAGSASAGPAASTGSGAGGFGPYSQEQVEQFVKQLKHMDMLGIDTYVTCSGEIFDREELRQVIKRFDR